LREFDVDHVGVPRAQAAQFLANGTGIVWIIEPYLAPTTGGPPAIPAGIPAGDPRIGPGSKCDAVRHYALLFLSDKSSNTGPSQIIGIGPDRDPKKTQLKKDIAQRAREEERRSSKRWAGSLSAHPGTWCRLDELMTALTFSGRLLTIPSAKELFVDVGV
jgi:hypothetical protein